ncbi:MAG: hypothetical protein ACOX5J_17375 [Candidatus Hydrogenedentales bacterium]|jgi:hypothetical protein
MSSILDALNKAEEERVAQEYALSRAFDDLDEGDIEDELTGRVNGGRGRGAGMPLTPFRVAVLALAFVTVVAAASGGAAWMVFHLRTKPSPMFSAESAGLSLAGVATASPVLPDLAARVTADPSPSELSSVPLSPGPEAILSTSTPAPQLTSLPAETVIYETSVPAPPTEREGAASSLPEDTGNAALKDTPSAPEASDPRVQVAAAEPPRPAATAQPAPTTPAQPKTEPPTPPSAAAIAAAPEPARAPEAAPRDAPPATKRVDAGEVDILALPELTSSDRRRLGLPDITVNVVGRPSKYRPQPSAMINFSRVVLNEYIPGTQAQLIGVSVHGIGIQVGGERYFVPK